MKFSWTILCAFLVAIVFSHPFMAPLVLPKDKSTIIPGRFIVVLKKQPNAVDMALILQGHGTWLADQLDSHTFFFNGAVEQRDAVDHYYALGSDGLLGYSGRFAKDLVDAIRQRPEVEYVETDQIMYTANLVDGLSAKQRMRKHLHMVRQQKRMDTLSNAIQDLQIDVRQLFTLKAAEMLASDSHMHHDGTNSSDEEESFDPQMPPSPLSFAGRWFQKLTASPRPQLNGTVLVQSDAPWGLSRVSQKQLPTDLKSYQYPKSAGKGVDVYVIDTGINTKHVEFQGRAYWGATIPFHDLDIDGNGHGTHCAGTIAGKTYGIAKKAHVIAVKVLRTSGFGTNSDVLKGVEWAVAAAGRGAKKGRRSVANMSLGGGFSQALNDAVDQAVAKGMLFAVAAGNDNEDACQYSPAASKSAITVGASDIHDAMAFFSNHGKCVDVFAPGMDILSAWIGSRTATNTISGTSMASPHVAGVLALFADLYGATADATTIHKMVLSDAGQALLKDLPIGSPNLLLSTVDLLQALRDGAGDDDSSTTPCTCKSQAVKLSTLSKIVPTGREGIRYSKTASQDHYMTLPWHQNLWKMGHMI